MVKKRQLWLTALFILFVGILSAQEAIKSYWVFHFVPQKDMFYVPYEGNEAELKDLLDVLTANMEHLRTSEMYIHVSSYAVSGSVEMSARRMAYLRASRVKSALITKGGITEGMFVSDRLFSHACGRDSIYNNVVVVSFPASVEKVEQLAGTAAAAKVRIYKQGIDEKRKLAEVEKRDAEEKERIITRPKAIGQEPQETKNKQEVTAVTPEMPEPGIYTTGYQVALRTNLLRWATLTPDLGVEWRINRHVGILVNGSWTSWSWDDKNRRYALWKVSPEVRYYIGKEKRGYLGAMYHIGNFNYKLGGTGKQGDYQGGGIIGGYLLELNRALSLDFHAGIGYTRAEYDKYRVTEGVRVRQGNETKNYWGINQLGVTLVWKPF